MPSQSSREHHCGGGQEEPPNPSRLRLLLTAQAKSSPSKGRAARTLPELPTDGSPPPPRLEVRSIPSRKGDPRPAPSQLRAPRVPCPRRRCCRCWKPPPGPALLGMAQKFSALHPWGHPSLVLTVEYIPGDIPSRVSGERGGVPRWHRIRGAHSSRAGPPPPPPEHHCTPAVGDLSWMEGSVDGTPRAGEGRLRGAEKQGWSSSGCSETPLQPPPSEICLGGIQRGLDDGTARAGRTRAQSRADPHLSFAGATLQPPPSELLFSKESAPPFGSPGSAGGEKGMPPAPHRDRLKLCWLLLELFTLDSQAPLPAPSTPPTGWAPPLTPPTRLPLQPDQAPHPGPDSPWGLSSLAGGGRLDGRGKCNRLPGWRSSAGLSRLEWW